MIEIRLHAAALANVRYAADPVWETVSAYQSLLSRESQIVHRRLAAVVDEAGVELGGLLAELLGDPAAMPGFVLPTPDPTLGDHQRSFERILRTPPDAIEADLAWLRSDRPTSEAASLGASQLMERTHDRLWEFRTRVLDPMWARIDAVTDADIAHRSARLAADGLRGALDGLHPKVSFTGDAIRIAKPQRVRVDAQEGLWLVPNVFRWPSIAAKWADDTPVLCYAARGAAQIWDEDRSADDRVARLLGRSRAEILALTGLPASTTEIAVELGLAKASVSEHLSALTAAGLTTSRRSGRRILYERTGLGDAVMSGGGVPGAARRSTG